MEIITFTGGAVQTNGYFAKTAAGNLLFDAPAEIDLFLKSKDLSVDHLFLTHQHFDHVEDADVIDAKKYCYEAYNSELIRDKEAREWGLDVSVPPFEVNEILKERESLQIGDLEIQLLYVPGHSPDSLAFYLPSEGVVFGGDALFEGGIGRPDLPDGDEATLLRSISEKLYVLPDETIVYPGHGPSTTIGKEKRSNPFIRG
ncbi:MBL fold metallo-hydrolase [Akkermansiaceae bacterium]|nr:MBL fold metallo-hydrolase [Akkermansiaceae bacterium]MDB4274981.1 MBL fold metallo-hydrolase [Akkermansiaceae bacterium]MDB4433852.1 MBL fold metallo-hydrolase [Akkermansiaceae bacterium]MDB4462921.1 MBL fold metallo-hydrolase [Akkermansiaceae bacterium]MDB4577959.1 MBL fold metallo-hydrolase [Akkermansiaceae bacterium]